MKKYLLFSILICSLTVTKSQSLMTIGEIYDYNVGNVFVRSVSWWGPNHYDKTMITDKYFSPLLDTVYYTYDKYSYTAPSCSACVALYDTTYGIHISYTNLKDTVGAGLGMPPHYWNPDCIDTAGYTGIWVDTVYYDTSFCNLLSTKISKMDNGPQLTDSCYWYFEAHWGYDEYGKGVGSRKHYYNTCSEGPFTCEEGSWLVYYKKGNDSCGSDPKIPPPIITNVNGLKFVDAIEIFPNPATNYFVLKNTLSNEKILLQIISPLDEVIYSIILFGGNEYIIDQNFTRGIYFVRISEGEINVVKKLVFE